MPVTFIGDVHGWNRRLGEVLAQAEGQVVLVGDLVDRGPETPAVLDRVHARCAAGSAACILGNHEWMLIHALGRLGAEPDEDAFAAWVAGWGGEAVLAAYAVTTAPALKRALARHWEWLCHLPWLLRGAEAGRRWIAVHAALDPRRPTSGQLVELEQGWDGPLAGTPDSRPLPLFLKRAVADLPADFPADTCLVSGHTPQPEPLITPRRILCDTTGGLPGRRLTGVVWPDLRPLRST